MSSNLYCGQWLPSPRTQINTPDQYHFRSKMAERFLGHDGSVRYDPGEIVFEQGNAAYQWALGMADAGNLTADYVLDLVELHGQITLWVGE